jgi:hypothetical protein
MTRKYLVTGTSITIVVLIVLGLLSNVVGYQSVKSKTVNDSPLFQTRTQRATNQQQTSITSQYLGMNRGKPLQFPINDNQTQILKKAIELISNTDEKTYASLEKLFINSIRQIPAFHNTNIEVIKEILQSIRAQPQLIMNAQNHPSNIEPTYNDAPTICVWYPRCYLIVIAELTFEIFLAILFTPILIATFIHMLIDTYLYTLHSACVTVDQRVTIWPPCPDTL